MYLGTKLIEYGFNIITNKSDVGPDFRINIDDKTYLIEAVAPECGYNNGDSLKEMQSGVHELPRREFLLRLSNAVNNKIEKFEKYLGKRIVNKNEILIIAISTCNLKQYGSLMDWPCSAIDTLLYGKGQLSINFATGEKNINNQESIMKSNGSEIKTGIFNDENCIINGVIYTHDEPLNEYNKIYFRENDNKKVCNKFKSVFLSEEEEENIV